MDAAAKRIVIYLTATFALTWGWDFAVVWPAATGSLGGVPAVAVQALVALSMFFPALSVVATRLVTREGFCGTSMIVPRNFRRTWKYWMLGWFGPSLCVIGGAVLYFALFPGDFDPACTVYFGLLQDAAAQTGASVAADQLSMLVTAQLVVGIALSPALNAIACFGEEWGWRGYLLVKLHERMGVLPTLALSGAIWGLWHAPIIALGHNYGTDYAGYPIAGILAMVVFCTVVGVFLSYVTLRSGSCLPAVFGHGALNGVAQAGLLFSATGGNPFVGPMPTGIVGGALLVACAVAMALALRREERGKQ